VGTWPRHAVRATIVFTVVVAGIFGSPPRDAVRAQADPPGDVNDVMLDEIDGFSLSDESTGQAGALTREFTGADGELQIIGFSVATPPGAEALFAASRTMGGFKFLEGLEFIDHPSIPNARWLVPAGALPGEDGLSLCRRLRSTSSCLPIIMLTAKAEEVDRIVGLELGGRRLSD